MDDLFSLAPSAPRTVDADRWIEHLFSARAAINGHVVRRKARDVERIVGWPRFRAELRRRGYSAVRNGAQVVVFCNAQPVYKV